MKKKISKTEAKEEIENFFKEIENKSPEEIRKIKRLSMNFKIPLKEKRKLFCPKCFKFYSGKEKVRIKGGIKSITCEECGKISRWKID
jgi:RNase P subunit RPR2